MQIAVLVGIGIILLIGWAISFLQESAQSAHNNRQFEEKIKQKWAGRVIDKSKSLEERNADIIQNHIKQVRGGYQRSYYIENMVCDCIQDIVEAEGALSITPRHVYLSSWMQTTNAEYKALAESLLARFKARQTEVGLKEKEKNELDKSERVRNLKARYDDLIKQFYEITERKVSLRDDYGEENWSVLEKEIETLVQKIARREGSTDDEFKRWKKYEWNIPEEYKELSSFLGSSFKQFYAHQKSKPISNETDYTAMSGVDFEGHLMRLLEANGFTNIRGTPATGDQGADLLADRDGRKLIIQAKRYAGNVGNKAVQEVASAVAFYGGDEGWVITNSLFTKSAKELAQKTGIKLVDGHDLKRFSELYGNMPV